MHPRPILDSSRFPDHAPLIAAIKRRDKQGSALVDAALRRGLWDDHLIDGPGQPGLRTVAYRYFNSSTDLSLSDDLEHAFGTRKGPHSHDEPTLDDDTWPNIDKAAPLMDKHFAPWISRR